MMPKPQSVTVADATCPFCRASAGVTLRANKKGHLYIYCPPPGDGGCLMAVQARSDKADELLAAQAVKWRTSGYRAAYVGGAPAPKEPPADPPPPDDPPPDDPPPKYPAKPKRKSWLGGIIVDDEEDEAAS